MFFCEIKSRLFLYNAVWNDRNFWMALLNSQSQDFDSGKQGFMNASPSKWISAKYAVGYGDEWQSCRSLLTSGIHTELSLWRFCYSLHD
jgi:hypothetical protein